MERFKLGAVPGSTQMGNPGWVSRLLVVVFGVIAYFVTLMFSESTGFFQKALYAFTIYGACITPSLVAALVWERATKQGAIASICAGAVVTLAWNEVGFVRFIVAGQLVLKPPVMGSLG